MEQSLRRVGTGIITEDKEPEKSLVYLFLVDDINEVEDEIVGYEKDVKNTHKDIAGIASLDVASRGMSVKALYINRSTNQTSVPDVVIGEQVDVFLIGNSTQYFWSIGFQKSELRKHEHVVNQYSNKLKPAPFAANNTYSTTISTRDKYLGVKTSYDQDNTEACTYDIKIDTKEGILSIKDDQDNSIVLESMKKKITVTTLDVLIDAPNSRFTGDVLIDKGLTVKKDTNVSGKVKAGGGFYSSKTKRVEGHKGHIF